MSPRDQAAQRERHEATNRRLTSALRGAFARRPALPEDATLDVRMRHLEADVAEVRSRVNGLFFAVLGALALEVVGKVAL